MRAKVAVVLGLLTLMIVGVLIVADALRTPGEQITQSFIGGAIAGWGIGPLIGLAFIGFFRRKS